LEHPDQKENLEEKAILDLMDWRAKAKRAKKVVQDNPDHKEDQANLEKEAAAAEHLAQKDHQDHQVAQALMDSLVGQELQVMAALLVQMAGIANAQAKVAAAVVQVELAEELAVLLAVELAAQELLVLVAQVAPELLDLVALVAQELAELVELAVENHTLLPARFMMIFLELTGVI